MKCFAALLAAVALAKVPMTHEAMWLMKRVGAPVVSPDGRWVVMPVAEPAYDPKDQRADLWIVPADGSTAPRRLTYSKAGESGATWSPDSSRIAFSARRDGDEDAQIYVLDVASGGEAQRVTSQAGGASSPRFSPDGKSLLYETQFDPIAADRKTRKYTARVYTTFPIRNWDTWLDEKRPRVYVQALAGGPARDLLGATKLAAEPGFDGVTTPGGSELQSVWAPDGQSVVIAATVARTSGAFADSAVHLYQVPLSGGEPKALTSGANSHTSPYFHPNGKTLYALEERSGPKLYSLARVVATAWPGNTWKQIAPPLDRSVNTFGVSGGNLYALAEEHGHEKLFTVPAEGGAASLAVDLKQGVFAGLSTGGSTLVATWQSSQNPAEVVRLDPAAKTYKPLTKFSTEAAAAIDSQPVRHFWFTSSRGRRIHSMLALPPAFDAAKKYPLVVFIHGGPHTMSRDDFHTRWNTNMLTAPGYVALMTNYTGSTGFGEAFAQAIQGDPLKTPGDEINEAVDAAAKEFPFIDTTRACAGGASYGGHMANWLEATTTRYKCLFSHAGLINLESQWGTSDTIYHREIYNGGPVWEQGPVWKEQNPIRRAAHFKTPMLLTVGERDFRVPLNQTIENWSVLQRQKVPSKLIVFPDENHWILKGENSRFFFNEVHSWLAKYLKW